MILGLGKSVDEGFGDRFVHSGDEQRLVRPYQGFGDADDLFCRFTGAENDFRKSLPAAPVEIYFRIIQIGETLG